LDWSYIAGLFDGEGTVTHSPKGNHGNRPEVGIRIYNTDRKPLDHIKDFCAFGHVYAMRHRGPWRYKICYSFDTSNHEDVLSFAEKILPHAIIKRRQLEELVVAIKTYKWKQSPHPLNWNPETIRRLYWDEQKGSYEIARMLNTLPTTIVSFMRHRGIPRRPADQPKLGKSDTERVRALYWDAGMNQKKLETHSVPQGLVCESS